MKIIEPCTHDDSVFGATSSRWAKLPRVHITVDDEAGGVSIWHGYDQDGRPLKDSLWQFSPELTKLYADNAAKPIPPTREDLLKLELQKIVAKLDPDVAAFFEKVIAPSELSASVATVDMGTKT